MSFNCSFLPFESRLKATTRSLHRFYFATKRKCDLDNMEKLWIEALNEIVFEDDRQLAELPLSDSTNARSRASRLAVAV